MPARIIIVHDEPAFIEALSTALISHGLDVAAFSDPLKALDALDAARTVELVITRITFAPGKSNGLALARIIRFGRLPRRRPKVLFVASPELQAEAEGLGEFLPKMASIQDTANAVVRLLNQELHSSVSSHLATPPCPDTHRYLACPCPGGGLSVARHRHGVGLSLQP